MTSLSDIPMTHHASWFGMSGNEYLKNIFAVPLLNFLKLKYFQGFTAIHAKRSVRNCDAAELMIIPVTPIRTIVTSTTFKINPEKCVKCGLCEMRCPDYAIWLENVSDNLVEDVFTSRTRITFKRRKSLYFKVMKGLAIKKITA